MSSKNRCSICRKTFSRPDSLRRHLVNLHSDAEDDDDSEVEDIGSSSSETTSPQELQYSQSEERITLPRHVLQKTVDILSQYLC